jgi:AmmeMemoRadiSam system protein A
MSARRDADSKELGPAEYARACVECLVCGAPVPPAPHCAPFAERSACFVSIKQSGELRGCIGTLSPSQADLGEEIAHNAFSAAMRDPRFAPVGREELPGLSYTVDVLSTPERCTIDDLDPSCYGVIVACGYRRGVLLPDLPGIDTVARQVTIALRKAGIGLEERYDVERFRVSRYREGKPSDETP